MAKGLKFLFQKEEDCTIYVAKTKALISFVVFVFVYVKSLVSHDEAQIIMITSTMYKSCYENISFLHICEKQKYRSAA